MTPYFTDASLTVYQGDCREVLATLPAGSVHCVVTSPPYWGLRDYGVGGQLGLEPTPEAYIAAMVEVFRGVRRVLRDDGTVWLNMGDGYSGGGGFAPDAPANQKRADGDPEAWGKFHPAKMDRMAARTGTGKVTGLKPKDLIGMPWRLAFALQADGWYLRADIIWAKPNPMPESVTDRPTKSHEYLFLLSKRARYFYDAEAVRLAGYGGDDGRAYYANRGLPQPTSNLPRHTGTGQPRDGGNDGLLGMPRGGANLRSVWTIATQPYPGAHFATFPEKLVEPCIKAGTSERGVCPECGAPWLRESTTTTEPTQRVHNGRYDASSGFGKSGWLPGRQSIATTGWRPSCEHHYLDRTDGSARGPLDPVPATVLDIFGGSGTTAMVANRLGRRAILIDLSTDYLEQAMARNAQAPLELGA